METFYKNTKDTDSVPHRKVLFISYFFPPLGGAGVQRNLKYVKYLPQFMWEPYVLTVKDINYYVYDRSLLNEISPEIRIFRSGSLDFLRLSKLILSGVPPETPNNGIVHNSYVVEGSFIVSMLRKIRNFFTFPDSYLGWIPFAYIKGLKLIEENGINVIFAGIGRYSEGILAYLLSKKTGLPYLVDLRDGWTDDPYLSRPTFLHRKGHAFLERVIIGNANAVTAYGEILSQYLINRYPWLAERIHVIPNGFDLTDFASLVPKKRLKERCRIVYMGSLNTYHESNFMMLIEAIKLLPNNLLDTIEVMFVGQYYQNAIEQVKIAGLEKQISFIGYVSHFDALEYLASADAGLLFIRPGDSYSVTGKVFEYLMVRRPIIACIEPDGACADILRKAGQAEWITPPDDPKGLVRTIVMLAQAAWPGPKGSGWEQFSRQNNTKKLAMIFDQLVEEKNNRCFDSARVKS